MEGQTVGRLAPSPSGRMHIGNILTSLIAWLSARKKGGRVVLRMEDLDELRCPREYAKSLMEDLTWLGLTWDGEPVYQSERTADYEAAFDKLAGMGLVYPCFCSRAELHAASAPHRDDGQTVYQGACRGLSPSEVAERMKKRSPAMRLRVPDETFSLVDGRMGEYSELLSRDCGDFLLTRSDGVFAYQLAVVVDDAAMGVTEVVRGSDLLSSTPRQLYLYKLLGLTPPRFYHSPLVMASGGRRLSKRDEDLGIEELSKRYTAEELLGHLAYLAGFNPSGEPKTAERLLDDFEWERVTGEDIELPEDL